MRRTPGASGRPRPACLRTCCGSVAETLQAGASPKRMAVTTDSATEKVEAGGERGILPGQHAPRRVHVGLCLSKGEAGPEASDHEPGRGIPLAFEGIPVREQRQRLP